ncbi:hypothetical protein [Vibrio breoganii]|uniref:hypothetical protein n=1 Tax=Vibrio breoganii TaxID=553239 RepID=UPI000C83ED80|nr:hypothetical protein [Vibrio breoganii]PMK30646.1 hypothetical protein BCU03_09520 [Vibrio breoganii]
MAITQINSARDTLKLLQTVFDITQPNITAITVRAAVDEIPTIEIESVAMEKGASAEVNRISDGKGIRKFEVVMKEISDEQCI